MSVPQSPGKSHVGALSFSINSAPHSPLLPEFLASSKQSIILSCSTFSLLVHIIVKDRRFPQLEYSWITRLAGQHASPRADSPFQLALPTALVSRAVQELIAGVEKA